MPSCSIPVQAEADGNGVIHLVHLGLIQPAHMFPQTAQRRRGNVMWSCAGKPPNGVSITFRTRWP